MEKKLKAKDLEKKLIKMHNPKYEKTALRFFKSGKGQYSAKDSFLGIRVPDSRKIAKQFFDLSLFEIQKLLKSKWHEVRLCGLLILVEKFRKGDEKQRKQIASFYLKNTRYVNNWDLVDLSAHQILGEFHLNQNRKTLYDLSKSKDLWHRRISIVSTYAFIRKNDFKETLEISKILLKDSEDLIHKAVGWMLREVGKRDKKVLRLFLEDFSLLLPRTTLRYAIEKMSEKERKYFLTKKAV